MERWNPGWTLGRIEAGSRAGAEDPRGPRSVRRRLISKERLRPYGKVRSWLHAASFYTAAAAPPGSHAGQASNRTTSSPPVPVRARRDPRGLFASYSHSRTLDIGDCSVHRVPRQVLRAVACRYVSTRRLCQSSSRVPPAPQRTRRRSAGRARPPLATRPKGKRALPEHLPRCGPS